MVGSIVVIGALTHCALLHSVYDFKDTQMSEQCMYLPNPSTQAGYNARLS